MPGFLESPGDVNWEEYLTQVVEISRGLYEAEDVKEVIEHEFFDSSFLPPCQIEVLDSGREVIWLVVHDSNLRDKVFKIHRNVKSYGESEFARKYRFSSLPEGFLESRPSSKAHLYVFMKKNDFPRLSIGEPREAANSIFSSLKLRIDLELGKKRLDVILHRFLESTRANRDPYGELEKMAIDLAETCKNPEEFVAALETLSPIFKGIFYKKEEQIGVFPLFVGIALNQFPYPDLASKSENLALKYFIRFNDTNWINTLKTKRKTGTRTRKSNRELSFHFSSLANDYQRLGDFRKAKKYYEKSLKIAKEIGDKTLEAKCLTILTRAKNGKLSIKKSRRHKKPWWKLW